MQPAERARRTAPAVLAGFALALAGCGGDGAGTGSQGDPIDRSATATPAERRAEPSAVAGGTSTLSLDDRTNLLLRAAGIEIEPVGAATRTDTGFALPVTGDELGVRPLAGTLRHDGGIRFLARGQSVEATDLRLDLTRGAVTADMAGIRAPLLDVDFGDARISRDAASVVLPAADAALSEEAVAPLNAALGADVLRSGITVGEMEVEARWR